MKKIKFSQIKNKIVNLKEFKSLKEIKEKGFRIVKERDGDRYFILKKDDLKPILVKLGDIAEVKRGFTTGANEFFYLPNKYFDTKKEGKFYRLFPKQDGLPQNLKIEIEFLRPLIKSPKDCNNILIKKSNLSTMVFLCHENRKYLLNKEAYHYILWGEKNNFHKIQSIKNRLNWYDLGEHKIPAFTIIKGIWLRHFLPINNAQAYCDQQIYEVILPKEIDTIKTGLLVNSTLSALFFELEGRSNFGEGILWLAVYEARNLLIINPYLNIPINREAYNILKRQINQIFTEIGLNPNESIRSQKPKPLPDRKALDDIVFDVLGLTEEERNEVYWSVCELVKARLEKAKSV